jgi:hypothetical protein
MKKTSVFIFSMLLAVTLTAQKSIYIRPLSSFKFNNSFYERGRFFHSKSPMNFTGNDYYSFYNYGLHANTSQLNLGLGIGITLSKKNSFELVFASDNSSVKSAFVQKNSLYPSNYSSSLIGSTLVRVSADYHRSLYTNSRIDVRGTIGLGVFLPSRNNFEAGCFEYSMSGLNYTAMVQEIISTSNNISPVLKIGTGLDFKTKKGKPFCSLDVSLTYNPGGNVQSVSYYVYVTDNTQQTSAYSHSINSRGSGVNFQLSFPIQVLTIGTKK